jgi:hypothetical protein
MNINGNEVCKVVMNAFRRYMYSIKLPFIHPLLQKSHYRYDSASVRNCNSLHFLLHNCFLRISSHLIKKDHNMFCQALYGRTKNSELDCQATRIGSDSYKPISQKTRKGNAFMWQYEWTMRYVKWPPRLTDTKYYMKGSVRVIRHMDTPVTLLQLLLLLPQRFA